MSCCFRSRCLLLFVSLVVLFYVPTARADVRLHTLFSDHMVLQRDRPVPVWGWATPGEAIAVSINKAASKTPVRDGKWRVKTTADRDGKWHLKLPAMKAGGIYKLTVVGKNTLTVSDVLVGEVWVCIGQSNMQVTLGRSHLAGQDVPKAGDPLLRLGSMRAGVVACQPKSDAGFQWTASTPGSASAYSAVAYYYGRELREKLGVPVGLIQQSMGATDIECWTPEIGGKIVPSQAKWARMVRQVEADYQKLRNERVSRWTKLAQQAIANEEALPPLPPAVDNRMVQRGWMPLGLYNGMIHPMIPYRIRGAIWYQGEANNGEGMEYYDKMRALIGGWRRAWGQGDFPFYYVQIAPWSGYLNISAAGQYTFSATERDRPIQGALAEVDLWIDGKAVIDSSKSNETSTLTSSRKVRVRIEGDEKLLSLAEVQVFEAGSGVELQKSGKASQSSDDYGCPAGRASDGNVKSSFFDGSLSHTKAETNPWWSVDLGGDKSIGKIKIFNRGDCCGERLAGAVVEVLDGKDKIVWNSKLTSVATGSVHQFGGGASIKLSAGLQPFVLNYHEGGGPPALKLLYQGPGIDRQEIPASVFFREENQ